MKSSFVVLGKWAKFDKETFCVLFGELIFHIFFANLA